MNIAAFKAGSWQKGFEYRYFLPNGINQPFTWDDSAINELLEAASIQLGTLKAFTKLIPNVDMFIKMHVYKEALVSSKIEGTQTHMEEALMAKSQVNPERKDDWQEVNNYVTAMNMAIEELSELPLSNRLFKKVHHQLMQSVRGETKTPGAFRRSQNWIGGASIKDAIFIPPMHDHVDGLMSDLEKFLHNDQIHVPHLIKAAIAHYQFETIHPFLDGNGRLGRLMITLYLVANKIIEQPLLYLSDFFERNKQLYYDNLMLVRTKNDLRQWLLFFLVAVKETAEKSVNVLQQIVLLEKEITSGIILKMGRRATIANDFLKYLFTQPIVTTNMVSSNLNISNQTAITLIQEFEKYNILHELTGQKRDRIYSFERYLRMFDGN